MFKKRKDKILCYYFNLAPGDLEHCTVLTIPWHSRLDPTIEDKTLQCFTSSRAELINIPM